MVGVVAGRGRLGLWPGCDLAWGEVGWSLPAPAAAVGVRRRASSLHLPRVPPSARREGSACPAGHEGFIGDSMIRDGASEGKEAHRRVAHEVGERTPDTYSALG